MGLRNYEVKKKSAVILYMIEAITIDICVTIYLFVALLGMEPRATLPLRHTSSPFYYF